MPERTYLKVQGHSSHVYMYMEIATKDLDLLGDTKEAWEVLGLGTGRAVENPGGILTCTSCRYSGV